MMETERQPDSLDEDALRRRLIKRIALAGVAIAVLLGGLAVIDSMFTTPAPPSEPPASTAVARPLPVAATSPEPPQPQAVPSIKISAAAEESSSSSAPVPKPPRLPAKPAEVKQAAVKPPASPHPSTQGAQTERHFVLQMGVFNNVDNAQELLAKLRKNDVPAQIEARVQVGPFKTRAEADEARAKLKAMGLDRKSTRLNSSHSDRSRMPSSA